MDVVLGIDVACRAAHQATVATRDGDIVFSGYKFHTRPDELEKLWAKIGASTGDTVQVVMEPTRNAWAPLASWFARHGGQVTMVPVTQSADLRAYYSKHTKNDRLDSRVLAQLPLLHPEGLAEHSGQSPSNSLRRAVRVRSSLVKQRTAEYNRLDALLEMLGPAWYEALGSSYTMTALAILTRYANPHTLLKLGRTRLQQFIIRHSHRHWGEEQAAALIVAARESLELWGTDEVINFTDLAADIATHAGHAEHLTERISQVEERISSLYTAADPDAIIISAPGVGAVVAGVIAGRIGDPHRFHSLAAVRSYSGLVPSVSESGTSEKPRTITKAGDALLREAMFTAADHARRVDPQIAARYKRLREDRGLHHDSAVCSIAAVLLTRVVSCWRVNEPYQIRDLNGTALTTAQGRAIVATKHKLDKSNTVTTTRRAKALKGRGTDRGSQKSPSAPNQRPVTPILTA